VFNSQLNYVVARERARELRARAELTRLVGEGQQSAPEVTLRFASLADADRLALLAQLDSANTPKGPALVAEVDGRLRAALPLDGSAPIADPFHRGDELIELLRCRAAQLLPSR
jgi:hypothetical protein